MSKDFLYSLNGANQAGFKRFLDNFSEQPRIAWYPSAGMDFRALLYLSREFSIKSGNVTGEINFEPKSPDIFIYTDSGHDFFQKNFSPSDSSLPKNRFQSLLFDATDLGAWDLYDDGRTRIEVKYFENLPDIICPSNKRIEYSSGGSESKSVVYMELKVKSKLLGTYKVPLIYINAENESFCSRYLLGKASISHVIHVRYGGGMGGGGYASGVWLTNVLKELQTEVYITDNHHDLQNGDIVALKLYPNLNGDAVLYKLPGYRTVPGASWSNHGDVQWNLVK